MNLGVGYSGGRAWLSIFQNSPTTDAKLEFSVEIKGGDDMSGSCKYSNGQYCSDTGCSPDIGCTVSSHISNTSNAKESPLTINTGIRRLWHRHLRLLRLDMDLFISIRMTQAGPALPPLARNLVSIKKTPGVHLLTSDISGRPGRHSSAMHIT
jgi:hypothetical protein